MYPHTSEPEESCLRGPLAAVSKRRRKGEGAKLRGSLTYFASLLLHLQVALKLQPAFISSLLSICYGISNEESPPRSDSLGVSLYFFFLCYCSSLCFCLAWHVNCCPLRCDCRSRTLNIALLILSYCINSSQKNKLRLENQ